MTMILGIHLSRKLYLVSDTRLTYTRSDGSKEYKDNLIKSVTLNKRISVVAAGDANLASFVIKKTKGQIRANSSASYVNYIIENCFDDFVKEYVNRTGRVNICIGLIFAGFNLNRPKIIDSSLLGGAMSALAMTQEGKMINQSVDPEIISALHEAATRQRGLAPHTRIKVDGLMQSEMITAEVHISQDGYNISTNKIDTYEYAVYHPSIATEKITIPIKLLSELDFRELPTGKTGEDVIYDDAAILGTFMNQTAAERKFDSVGGNIFTTMVTPEGTVFPTGEMVKFLNGAPSISSLFVKDDILCYRLPNGETGQYQNLENSKFEEALEI